MSQEIFDLKALLAEILATFGLVFIGGMVVMQSEVYDDIGILEVAVAHFVILALMVYFARPISGGHVNPAITIGFLVTGRMNTMKGVLYIAAQLIGSIMAGILLRIVAGDLLLDAANGGSELGFPHLTNGYSQVNGMILELIMTFFFVFIFWATAVDDKAPDSIYGAAIGGAFGVNILAAGTLTGGAMNPARVFGPALIALDFANHWIYWIGPIFGAIIAAFLYNFIFLQNEEETS